MIFLARVGVEGERFDAGAAIPKAVSQPRSRRERIRQSLAGQGSQERSPPI